MPITGKTYGVEGKGKLYVYDHATSTWTIGLTSVAGSPSVIKVYPYDEDKIIIGGNSTLVYSNDAGATTTVAVGDWSTLCPNVLSMTTTDDINIIYGIGKTVIKSIDGGVTFNALPSFPATGTSFGLAIHFANSLVGVASFTTKVFKTIDGGVNWTPLYGGSAIDPINSGDYVAQLHISISGNIIIAVTRRSVFRSTDGGNSFTNVLTFGSASSPRPNLVFGYANDNYFILYVNSLLSYRSDNAGASWVSFSTGQTPDVYLYPGSIYETYKGFYAYYNSSEGPTGSRIYELQETSPGVFSSTLSLAVPGGMSGAPEITSLTSTYIPIPCYTLTPCTPEGSIITVSNDFSIYANGYVQIDGSCFFVEESLDCVGTILITYTSIASIVNCTACNTPEIVYGLVDCSNQLPTLYTTEALTPGISGYLGDVLYIQGYPNTCWIVITEDGTTQAITILNDYASCPECIAEVPIPLPPPVYQLENCVTEEILYTLNSQFAQAVDQVVNLEGYLGECWSVTELVFDNQTTTSESIAANKEGTLAIYENCPCCLPAVPPEPIKYTRVIPKPDRKFYQIQQSQCDITANIRFADAYYRLFKQLKYGISSQCDNVDLDKRWIKKNLSDLAVINDPTACVITTPVTPVICPEPS